MARIEMLRAGTSTCCSASGGIKSDLLNELPQFFPGGTRRFSSSNQLRTTLIALEPPPLARRA